MASFLWQAVFDDYTNIQTIILDIITLDLISFYKYKLQKLSSFQVFQ